MSLGCLQNLRIGDKVTIPISGRGIPTVKRYSSYHVEYTVVQTMGPVKEAPHVLRIDSSDVEVRWRTFDLPSFWWDNVVSIRKKQ